MKLVILPGGALAVFWFYIQVQRLILHLPLCTQAIQANTGLSELLAAPPGSLAFLQLILDSSLTAALGFDNLRRHKMF